MREQLCSIGTQNYRPWCDAQLRAACKPNMLNPDCIKYCQSQNVKFNALGQPYTPDCSSELNEYCRAHCSDTIPNAGGKALSPSSRTGAARATIR